MSQKRKPKKVNYENVMNKSSYNTVHDTSYINKT